MVNFIFVLRKVLIVLVLIGIMVGGAHLDDWMIENGYMEYIE